MIKVLDRKRDSVYVEGGTYNENPYPSLARGVQSLFFQPRKVWRLFISLVGPYKVARPSPAKFHLEAVAMAGHEVLGHHGE